MAAATSFEMMRMDMHGIDYDSSSHRMGKGSDYDGEGVFEDEDDLDDEMFDDEDEDDELPDDEEDDEVFGEDDG